MKKLIQLVTYLAICLIGVAVFFVLVVRPDAEPSIKPTNSNRSVLVQIRDDAKFGVLNFVIAPGSAKWFYVPNDLLLKDAEDPVTLGSAAHEIVLLNTRNTFNDVNGLEVSDVWQIDFVAFASFVEAADGVEIQSLHRTVSGFEAVSYIFESTQNPKIQLERFKEIWPQLVRSFGTKDLPNILTSIGSSSRSTIEQNEFVGYLKMMNKQFKNLKFAMLSLNDEKQLQLQSRTRLIEAGVRERMAP